MTPRFKFKFINILLYPAGEVVKTPVGWKDVSIVLERDTNFHSLIEYFNGSFIWYGRAREIILEVIASQGVDAIIELQILIRFNNAYTPLFTGVLDLSMANDIDFNGKGYKIDVPIIRDDFWAKFINRYSMPTDVRSSIDKDGEAVTPAVPYSMVLTGQKIHSIQKAEASNVGYPFLVGSNYFALGNYVPLDIFSNILLDELETFTSTGREQTAILPQPFFKALYGGSYRFTSTVYIWDGPIVHTTAQLQVAIQVNNDAPIVFSRSLLGISYIHLAYRFVYIYFIDSVLTLEAGDEVVMYMKNVSLEGSAEVGIPPFLVINGVLTKSTLEITGDTAYQNTSAKALLIHDVWSNVIKRITGKANSFYSEYFGRTTHGYAVNGCGSAYALLYGKHVRGISFANKPFAPSVEDCWNGANPLFNLGLSYETIGPNQVVRVEPKSYFYNDTVVLYLSNVKNISKKWDGEFIFRSIQNGYQSYSVRDKGGIDDPQGKVTHNTRLATIGTDFDSQSTWFAAGLGIESVRRLQGADNTVDSPIDDTIVVIALNKSNVTLPELDENFDAVTNLFNSDSRYNIRLSANRLFKRWQNFFAGSVTIGSRKDFYFASGEGNNLMTSKINVADCEGGATLAENKTVVNNGVPLFTPKLYEFSVPLTFDQYLIVRNNRNKSIAFSEGTTEHISCSIKSMEWLPVHGKANFLVWLKQI